MWKCPMCETLNTNESCIICGSKMAEAIPEKKPPVYTRPYSPPPPNTPPQNDVDEYFDNDEASLKKTGCIVTIALIIIFIFIIAMASKT